jgi:hypothetical protein
MISQELAYGEMLKKALGAGLRFEEVDSSVGTAGCLSAVGGAESLWRASYI